MVAELITIVDYGTSNLGSMRNMLKKIGVRSEIASTPEAVLSAGKIIIPGVGAFDAGMRKLQQSGLIEALNHKALVEKVPILGVCLGMQLMTEGSEEGELPGLGWVSARTVRFDQKSNPSLRVPHMGWNLVRAVKDAPLANGAKEDARFYFAHSYFVSPGNRDDVVLEATYGNQNFAAAFQKDNIMGAQFHPEKSHRYGIAFLRNFVEL
ncbi:imidazole glycerol phosphate synthase subunit HisH [Brucella sp. IR073]|uniref:imidazole glycerol phosphate synthase subunit HisH n=1 Tax=unclassified Brucella TaxID=2632610 RepID=UPI003B982B73